MSRRRLQLIVLSVLATTAAALGVWRIAGGAGEAQPAAANSSELSAAAQSLQLTAQPVQAPPRSAPARAASVPLVRLDALKDPRPAPLDAGRDPFRFKVPRPVVAANGRGIGPQPKPVPALPPVPAGPPPPPPITLKFVGIVQAKDRGLKLAVLSDGRGVYFGSEGQIIEGRYRIVRIGVESVVVTYVDGTGQRTIPLSGS